MDKVNKDSSILDRPNIFKDSNVTLDRELRFILSQYVEYRMKPYALNFTYKCPETSKRFEVVFSINASSI